MHYITLQCITMHYHNALVYVFYLLFTRSADVGS